MEKCGKDHLRIMFKQCSDGYVEKTERNAVNRLSHTATHPTSHNQQDVSMIM